MSSLPQQSLSDYNLNAHFLFFFSSRRRHTRCLNDWSSDVCSSDLATHSFMFHQIEGLAVDTDITFCDFTGTIEYFVKQFFGPSVKTRFRPSYFPFTEPSVEFDVSCIFCGGSGVSAGGAACGKCKGSCWIELFGAGMVDPAVYGFVNYDPKKLSGFAFGMGMDRLAMLKYGIDDIQAFFQNDVRFLRQFP